MYPGFVGPYQETRLKQKSGASLKACHLATGTCGAPTTLGEPLWPAVPLKGVPFGDARAGAEKGEIMREEGLNDAPASWEARMSLEQLVSLHKPPRLSPEVGFLTQ